MRKLFILALLLVVASPVVADSLVRAPQYGDQFWSHWGDGQAELAAYDLIINRYGEEREGTAVAIFVTETFSAEDRVKADPGRHAKDDEIPVIKLNLVQDFPTGIYDYNLMTSAFVQVTDAVGMPAGSPLKTSFSSQEWCGHVYQQSRFDADAVRIESHSYFDGEADRNMVLYTPRVPLSEDVLLLWARGLAGPALEPGESREVSLLMGSQRARLSHQTPKWEDAVIMRSGDRGELTVPAGEFEVEMRTVEVQGGPAWTFYVETAWPHRLVQWENSNGDEAKLLGSERMAYWALNGPGGEKMLEKLGLSARPLRMP